MAGQYVPPDSLAQDIWTTATGQENLLPLVFRFRQHLPVAVKRTEDFPTLVNVYWRFDGSNSNGMPPPADNEQQISFEDAIAPIDGADSFGFLMLVVTGNSRKEWVFYVKDISAWLDRFNQLLAGRSAYPIEIQADTDPDWSTWRGVAACAQN